jgi:hypothetical protein
MKISAAAPAGSAEALVEHLLLAGLKAMSSPIGFFPEKYSCQRSQTTNPFRVSQRRSRRRVNQFIYLCTYRFT